MRSVPLLVFILLMAAFTAPAAEDKNSRVEFYRSEMYPDYPFAEAVRAGETLYLSGNVGADDEGKLVAGGIGPETRRTMENVKATLARFGLTYGDVVKCTVFLADIANWQAFNEIYAGYFGDHFPARSALGANGLALGAQVELECIAVFPGGP